MRGLIIAGFGVLAVLSWLAGCSLITNFDDQNVPPPKCDGGACEASADVGASDGATTDRGAPSEASPACDAAAPTGTVCASPCAGSNRTGWFCGDDLPANPCGPNVLYHCVNDALVGQAEVCGCFKLPSGHPDVCDPCASLADGDYCGRDILHPPLPADELRDDDVLFQCRCGVGTFSVCAAGCAGAPTAAVCTN